MWLLDTNVASELSKPRPNASVIDWLYLQTPSDLWLSVVTIAELRFGTESCTDLPKRQRLEQWLKAVRAQFLDRTAVFTEETLMHWQIVLERCHSKRHTLPQGDSLIAAIASERGMRICSRDAKPYAVAGLPVFNPWTGERFNGA